MKLNLFSLLKSIWKSIKSGDVRHERDFQTFAINSLSFFGSFFFMFRCVFLKFERDRKVSSAMFFLLFFIIHSCFFFEMLELCLFLYIYWIKKKQQIIDILPCIWNGRKNDSQRLEFNIFCWNFNFPWNNWHLQLSYRQTDTWNETCKSF